MNAPLLRSPSAAEMGARGAGSLFVRFLRWFFLGRPGGLAAGEYGLGYAAVMRARRAASYHFLIRVLVVLVVIVLVGWAMRSPLLALGVVAAFVVAAGAWFGARARARRLLLDAALRPVTETSPLGDEMITAPRLLPGRAVQMLAVATDRARRGEVVRAADLTHRIDEPFLEDDERRLLSGVRALIAERQGDRAAAARYALAAFPVGAPDIDERLARLFAATSWHDATRLSRAWEDWSADGFTPGTDEGIARLLWLIEVKLGHRDPAAPAAAAEVLAEEARALGDAELADRIVNESRAGRAADYR